MSNLYQVQIYYRRTRPYYPNVHPYHALHKNGIDSMAEPRWHVIGPYKSLGTLRAQYKKHLREHPFANIWGDNVLGYEILDEKWEVGEVTTVWKELD